MKFVAILHSQFHLLAFKAFYQGEMKTADEIEGEIFIRVDNPGEQLLSPNDFDFLDNCKISIINAKDRKTLFKKIIRLFEKTIYFHRLTGKQRKGDTLYIIMPENSYIEAKVLYQYQKEYKADNIMILFLEEGIGSYIRDFNRWQERGLENYRGLKLRLLSLKTQLLGMLGTKRIVDRLSADNQVLYFKLFENLGNGLLPNEKVCTLFSEVFDAQANMIDTVIDYKSSILINSQPFFEELDSNIDLICYLEIKTICERKGIRVIIKPHPRERKLERYEEIGLLVDNDNRNVSQEVLLAKARHLPLMVLGFFSTTLITSNLFYKTIAVSLGNLCDIASLAGFKTDIINFNKVFNNVLFTPKNFDEFENILNRCIQEEDKHYDQLQQTVRDC